jgi:hypothetical protein
MLRFTCDAMESMAVTLEAIAQLDVLMAEAEVILIVRNFHLPPARDSAPLAVGIGRLPDGMRLGKTLR